MKENQKIGGCSKHQGESMIDCPLCAIENFPKKEDFKFSYKEKKLRNYESLKEIIDDLKSFHENTVIKILEETIKQGYYLEQSRPQPPQEPPQETNPLLIDIQETFTKCYELLKSKNNDYAGEKTQDPFSNFRKSEAIGVKTEKGILVRMMDKMSRVSNLIEQDASVKTEKIEDTLEDLINYAAILKSYIKNKNK